MFKPKRIVYLLWDFLLLLASASILTLTFLFPTAPAWVDNILWILFGYSISSVLSSLLAKLKPSVDKSEKVSEFLLLKREISEMKTSLTRIESKLDKLSKK